MESTKQRQPILITGCPRSGKTLIAQILQISGIFFGETNKMLENEKLSELTEAYQQAHDISPASKKSALSIPQDWESKVSQLMLKQGYKDKRWAFKHADISTLWPIWKYSYPEAKVIIVRRSIEDIVPSCMKTKYMTQCDTEEEWAELMQQYETKYPEMILSGMNCKTIWPHEMVNGNYAHIYELLRWLDIPWKAEIVSQIDPKFWKSRKK